MIRYFQVRRAVILFFADVHIEYFDSGFLTLKQFFIISFNVNANINNSYCEKLKLEKLNIITSFTF